MDANAIANREALHRLVWNEPMASLAMRYGLSESSLSRLCRRLGVPIPGPAYWEGIRNGMLPRIRPLPAASDRQMLLRLLIPMDTGEYEKQARRKQELTEVKLRVRVGEFPPLGADTHPSVKILHRHLNGRDGRREKRGSRNSPGYVAAIDVTSGSVDRACRLASVLFYELERQGAIVSLDADLKFAALDIGGVCVRLAISEEVTGSEPVRNRPTAALQISAGTYPRRTWRDGPKRALERRLGTVVSEILLLADQLRTAEEKRLRSAQERQARIDEHEEALAKWQAEHDAVDRLMSEARRWDSALLVRRYIAAVSESLMLAPDGGELQSWLRWAGQKADWLDPLVHAEDAILDSPKPSMPDGNLVGKNMGNSLPQFRDTLI